MKFIVYEETAYSGTQHLIIRSGDAPPDQISIQADDGEVAIESPGGWVMPETGQWLYDTSNEEITALFIPMPPGGMPIGADGVERIKARVADYLRRTDWTQLPDAPLTSAEVTAYADYRAYLRTAAAALTPSSTSGELISTETGPPGGIWDEPL